MRVHEREVLGISVRFDRRISNNGATVVVGPHVEVSCDVLAKQRNVGRVAAAGDRERAARAPVFVTCSPRTSNLMVAGTTTYALPPVTLLCDGSPRVMK